ncbi:MAG TPA: RraA family protein [Clostridia bacterium]|nr:RraA family protein [Clostridia bacterium]
MTVMYDRYKELSSACVSDALKGLNNMNVLIKPMKEEYRISGPAFTVKMPANDNLVVLKGIGMAKPGDILIVDAKGHEHNAVAGHFVIGMAKTLGLSGVVIDGTIRDIVGIKALDFPVFCKGATVAASVKTGTGEVNVPVTCGGVVVNPGDIIVGDADGVVSVPKERAEEVLAAAQQKEQKDKERAKAVLGNGEAARCYIERAVESSRI